MTDDHLHRYLCVPISITNFQTDIRFLLLKLKCYSFINIECQYLYFPNMQIVLIESKLFRACF